MDENERKIYQCLLDELTETEKKELLIHNNVTLRSFQARRLKKESQWSAIFILFRNSLGKYKTAIIKYFVETILYDEKQNEDNANKDEAAKEEKHSLDRETLISDSQDKGFYKVLIYLIIHFEYEKAVQLIDDVPKEQRFRNKKEKIDETIELSKEKELIDVNKNLLDENKKLMKKIERQSGIIESLENKYDSRIKCLESEQTKKLIKFEEKHRNYQLHAEHDRKELGLQLLLSKKQVDELVSREKELEIENNGLKQKIGQLIKEKQNRLMHIEQLKNDRKKKILIFGNIPREITSDLYDYTIFDLDASDYPFVEHFDEYWIINDKLPPKLRVKLERNQNKDRIDFKRMDYYKMIEQLSGKVQEEVR